MTEDLLPSDAFRSLAVFDTPTVCNALEMLDSERRRYGYTKRPMYCLFPDLPPIVGYAKTATIRSREPSGKSGSAIKEGRIEYYKYIGSGVGPKIVLMQDLDGTDAAYGPFWGEFNSNVHKALGCVGVVTDGAVRDIKKIPNDFQMLANCVKPSHAFVHIVDYSCQVSVASMAVRDGDIVHADCHGAVTFPGRIWSEVVSAAKDFMKSEEPVIQACKRENLTIDELIEIYSGR